MMKWHAVEDKSGAYEIRCSRGEMVGGIVIDGKNEGAGFIGNVEENRYIFKFEEGIFSKSVKIFAGGKVVTQIGIIKTRFYGQRNARKRGGKLRLEIYRLVENLDERREKRRDVSRS